MITSDAEGRGTGLDHGSPAPGTARFPWSCSWMAGSWVGQWL